MTRKLLGAVVGVLAAAGVGGLMLPIRPHLSIATVALVLVIPVVIGVTVGGWIAGLVSVAVGFLVYDFAYIPPYGTLTVGSPQNWVALVVYVVVMVVVARLVTNLHDAETTARSRADMTSHLLDLSELLLTSSPSLAETIVDAIKDSFNLDGVALVQPVDGELDVVASAGTPISRDELSRLRPEAHLPVPLSTGASAGALQALALASSGRPIGILALRNVPASRAVRDALPILANHVATALERAELQTRARQVELLEQIDRLRQALVGAVSHDLRTPLATIKIASSTLVGTTKPLSSEELSELYGLIDEQADRLARLVSNLLDMTRIQSGSLEVRRSPTRVEDLVRDAVTSLHSTLGDRPVKVISLGEVSVDADPVLLGQVLANLLDNANRHAPDSSAILVEVSSGGSDEASSP